MSRQFAIGVGEAATPEQQKELREFFLANGSWWNWIPNFWLVTTEQDTSARSMRNQVMRIAPGADCIVIEVAAGTWSGYGPNRGEKERNMFRWLHGAWTRAAAKSADGET